MRTYHYALLAAILSMVSMSADADVRSRCESLTSEGSGETVRIKASLVGPGFELPETYFRLPAAILHFGQGSTEGTVAEAVPVKQAFCRVEGVAPSAIRFEVWLPVKGWNGRMLGVGNGAMAGAINYPAIHAGMREGYATVGSDLGHQGGIVDSRFALGHPELLVDWGHRATHVMTQQAQWAIRAFYGESPAFSYFAGCSGGGRQGMMEAQRYPEDYDGILAGNPIMNFTRLTMAGRLWAQLAMYRQASGAGYIPQTKIPAISRAVLAACDHNDGLADGIIDDPRQCHFDPATIQCRSDDGPDCLTAAQVASLGKIYAGAHDSAGRKLFSGYSPGGEEGPGGWASYFSGTGPYTGGQWVYAQGVLPSLLYGDPEWDIRSIDYDSDVDRALALPVIGTPMGEVIDAYNPDLSAFAARGGKLLHYHGWSDPGVPPLNSIAYYDNVVGLVAASNGISPEDALHSTRSFYRLFMVPGMQHCTGGPGHDLFDGLIPLREWVELGLPPSRIVAYHAADGRIDRSRPLCPYPGVAKWNGRSSSRDAANFVCVRGGQTEQ